MRATSTRSGTGCTPTGSPPGVSRNSSSGCRICSAISPATRRTGTATWSRSSTRCSKPPPAAVRLPTPKTRKRSERRLLGVRVGGDGEALQPDLLRELHHLDDLAVMRARIGLDDHLRVGRFGVQLLEARLELIGFDHLAFDHGAPVGE